MEDSFLKYKQALKTNYEQEKNGIYSNYLLFPTSAKIRELLVIILTENPNQNDLNTFRNFMGFPLEKENLRRLKNDTDKFKPLATFLKGETELSEHNQNGADILAIILNIESRPFNNFRKKNFDNFITEDIQTKKISVVKNEEISNPKPIISSNNKPKKKLIFSLIGIGLILPSILFFYNKNDENCMVWDNNHYKRIDCDEGVQYGFFDNVTHNIKADETLLKKFRKIEVDQNTVFFDAKKQPLIWYGRSGNGRLEYFSHHGLHPETGKNLRPITNYMIRKYIIK